MPSGMNYYPPSAILFEIYAFSGLALLQLSAAAALFRVPRIAGQRRWRQWLAVAPMLTGLAAVALALTALYVYLALSQDAAYTPQAFCTIQFGHFQCGTPHLDATARQALSLLATVDSFGTSIILVSWGMAVLCFLVLAIGRRHPSPVRVPAEVVS